MVGVADDTRARILRAAQGLFVSRGYHATSVREIAEKLGLTKTAVLYHFPSKKDIIVALADPLLSDMEAAVDAANRIEGADPYRKRWAVIEGLIDVQLSHRYLLRMNLQDLALISPAYHRFRDAAILAEHLIAGPFADLTDRIRAAQAFAMLSDPIVMFADLPAEMLRATVLAGVRRLLDDTPPAPAAAPPARSAPPRSRRGRPAAMSPEMIETARRMHASGQYSATEIADALQVSRATVYRHLPVANIET
jgi:AcrR family transcriptional regulator